MSLFQYGFTRQASRNFSDAISDTEDTDSQPSGIESRYLQEPEQTPIGADEYDQVVVAVKDRASPSPETTAKRKRGTYNYYSPEIGIKIGKYAAGHCNSKGIRHFQSDYPNRKESTVRTYKQAYKEKLEEQKRKGCLGQAVQAILFDPQGRPPMLLELDNKLITFIKSIRARGGVANYSVIKATSEALIKSNPSMSRHSRGFQPKKFRGQSVYTRCNFSCRAGATTRPPVPRGVYQECKFTFLNDIHKAIKKHAIPSELVLNVDQTPSSYVSAGRMTMTDKNASSVPIKGLTDKRNITLTFTISLSGEFLPTQIIYQGKTPRFSGDF